MDKDTACDNCRHFTYCKVRENDELAVACILHNEPEFKYQPPGPAMMVFGRAWESIQQRQQGVSNG